MFFTLLKVFIVINVFVSAGGEAEEGFGCEAGAGQVPPGNHRWNGPKEQSHSPDWGGDPEILQIRSAGETQQLQQHFFTFITAE